MTTIPGLEDLEDDLLRTTTDMLGETVQYAANGTAFAPVKADVVYGEAFRDIATGQMAVQEIAVTFLVADVAAKPTAAARLTLKRCPNLVFRPVNILSVGPTWIFEVERV